MNKILRILAYRLWIIIALCSVVVFAAACGQATPPTSIPNANPSAISSTPAVGSQAPLATTIPQLTATNSTPLTADNCTLLTKDDVGKILVEDVVDVREPSPDGSVCAYQTQNLILELTFLHQFGGFDNSINYMKNIRDNDESMVDVPGLGDEALFHGSPAYRLLLVRKGDVVYGFGVRNASEQSFSSPDNAQDLEKATAELLLTRLP